MSKLQDRLDESKKTFESEAPPYHVPDEAIEMMHQATAELKASGIEDRALKVGDPAPSFTLFNQDHVHDRPSTARTRWWSASTEGTGGDSGSSLNLDV